MDTSKIYFNPSQPVQRLFVCKGPEHQSYSARSLYICFFCNVTGTTVPRHLSSNTLRTPPYLINQAHCFTKVKLTNPSHTVLYGWGTNFKHQLSAEHVTDLSRTVDALSCAGRDHTLHIYGQETGKDVTFSKNMYENKVWINLVNKSLRLIFWSSAT